MKRLFSILLLLSIFISQMPTQAFAASIADDHRASRSDFEPFCGEDGRSCDCKVAFKNTRTNETYFVDGTIRNHHVDNLNIVALNTEDHNWKYAFYVGRPQESQTTENCFVTQEKTEDEVTTQEGADLDAIVGCAIGVTVTAAGSAGTLGPAAAAIGAACIAGEDNTLQAARRIGQFFVDPGEFWRGEWIQIRKNDNFDCRWSGNDPQCTSSEQKGCSDNDSLGLRGWRVAGWFSFDEDWKDTRISKIAFMGHRGSADVDEKLCGIGILKVDEGDAPTEVGELEEFALCEQIPGNAGDFAVGDSPKGKCYTCVEKNGIWTALGCIQKGIDPQSGAPDLISDLIGIGLGIAGGIALLLILAGSATYAMSQGDPKKATDAKETITAAIIGLLFIIFSVTILQFIGVTILRLPGF